jgi:hypothetical protein
VGVQGQEEGDFAECGLKGMVEAALLIGWDTIPFAPFRKSYGLSQKTAKVSRENILILRDCWKQILIDMIWVIP